MVAELGRIRAARDASGKKTLIEGGVGTAFGCTIQGEVKSSEVLRLMQALLDAGADRVSLADTVGYADPASVSRLFEQALKIAGDKFWCLAQVGQAVLVAGRQRQQQQVGIAVESPFGAFQVGHEHRGEQPRQRLAKASNSAVSASCGSSRGGTNEPTSISRWPAAWASRIHSIFARSAGWSGCSAGHRADPRRE